jgi:hypothetical protein
LNSDFQEHDWHQGTSCLWTLEVEHQLAVAEVGQHAPWVAWEVELVPVEEEVAVQLVPLAGEVEAHTDVVVVVPEVVGAVVDHETCVTEVQRTVHPHLTSLRPDVGVLGEWKEA